MAQGLLFALGGLAVLALAADQFVKGAARLAVLLKVAPVVVGAIVVGFGTSAPEMVVSGLAAADDRLDIGVGNVVGSNVANISLVLGAAALVTAVPVRSSTVSRDGLTSVMAVAVFALLVQHGLSRWEGALLIALLIAWLALVLRGARVDSGDSVEPGGDIAELVGEDERELSAWLESSRTLLGLVLVIVSAYFLVDGAEQIAAELGLSGGFVGYTLVAVGTSAPELVTAVAAARRRETDLLVGNLLGSNVFNSLAVGGLISIVGPGSDIDVTLQTRGAALMVLICLASWLAMAAGRRVTRFESVVLLILWIGSVALLAE